MTEQEFLDKHQTMVPIMSSVRGGGVKKDPIIESDLIKLIKNAQRKAFRDSRKFTGLRLWFGWLKYSDFEDWYDIKNN